MHNWADIKASFSKEWNDALPWQMRSLDKKTSLLLPFRRTIIIIKEQSN